MVSISTRFSLSLSLAAPAVDAALPLRLISKLFSVVAMEPTFSSLSAFSDPLKSSALSSSSETLPAPT